MILMVWTWKFLKHHASLCPAVNNISDKSYINRTSAQFLEKKILCDLFIHKYRVKANKLITVGIHGIANSSYSDLDISFLPVNNLKYITLTYTIIDKNKKVISELWCVCFIFDLVNVYVKKMAWRWKSQQN